MIKIEGNEYTVADALTRFFIREDGALVDSAGNVCQEVEGDMTLLDEFFENALWAE